MGVSIEGTESRQKSGRSGASAIPRVAKPPLLGKRDLVLLATMPVMGLLAWSLSARSRSILARILGGKLARARTDRAKDERARSVELFGDSIDHDAMFAAAQENVVAEWLQLLRLQRPGEPLPAVALIGAEHVDAALSKGKGAVLWIVRSTYSHTIAKIALHQKGYRVSHLSRPDHGFSPSRFGAAVLNPVRTRLEERFLAERVVITEKAGPVLAKLAALLRANQLVSITVGGTASRTHEVPCLNGKIRLSPRPVQLARDNGAALLAVVVEALPDGTFITTIFPDLLADDQSESDRPLKALADIIARYATKTPDQFAPPLLSELL